MGFTRTRHNDKGRAIKRESGKRKRVDPDQVDDSNADIIDHEVRKKRRAEVRTGSLCPSRRTPLPCSPGLAQLQLADLVARLARSSSPTSRQSPSPRCRPRSASASTPSSTASSRRRSARASSLRSRAFPPLAHLSSSRPALPRNQKLTYASPPHSKTQTQNLQFASSSALGSKQFQSQASKLEHAAALEESRRGRARKILDRANAGAQHLSDNDVDDDDEGGDDVDMLSGDDEAPLEREFVKPQQALALSTAAPPPAKKNTQPFNPSGSLGVVVEPAATPAPVASTSTSSSSSRPIPPPAPAPPAVGSALAAGATVTVVKRAPKQRGRMRELIGAVGKGKGKAKAEPEPEPEEASSEFDSSEEGSDEDEEGEGDEWKGIEGDERDEVEKGGSGPSEAGSDDDGVSQDKGSESDDGDDDDEEHVKAPPRERGAFRAWADEQVRKAAGEDAAAPRPVDDDDGTYKPLLPAGSGFKNKVDPSGITGPLGAVLPKEELPTLPPQKTVHVAVTRTPEIEASRAELPVVKEEDRVMQAILGNPVVVLCGETGSGKTTQVGQFLWEAGFGDPASGASRFICSRRRDRA